MVESIYYKLINKNTSVKMYFYARELYDNLIEETISKLDKVIDFNNIETYDIEMLGINDFNLYRLLEFVEVDISVLKAIIIQDIHNFLEENYNRFLERKNTLNEKCYIYYKDIADLHFYINKTYNPEYVEKMKKHRKKLQTMK